MFEMDPIYLGAEEIEYELLIRNVYDVFDHQRQKTSRLRELLKEENAGRANLPALGTSPFPPAQDISYCTEVLKQISEQMVKDESNRGEIIAFKSRLLHIEGRLLRLQTIDTNEKSIISQLLVEFAQLLEMANALLNPPKKIRNRRPTIADGEAPRLNMPDKRVDKTNRTDPFTYERTLNRDTMYSFREDLACGGIREGGSQSGTVINKHKEAVPKQKVTKIRNPSATQSNEYNQNDIHQKPPRSEHSASQNNLEQMFSNPSFAEEHRRSTSHGDLLRRGNSPKNNTIPNKTTALNTSAQPFMPSKLQYKEDNLPANEERARVIQNIATSETARPNYMAASRKRADDYDAINKMLEYMSMEDEYESDADSIPDNNHDKVFDLLRQKYLLLKNSKRKNVAPKNLASAPNILPQTGNTHLPRYEQVYSQAQNGYNIQDKYNQLVSMPRTIAMSERYSPMTSQRPIENPLTDFRALENPIYTRAPQTFVPQSHYTQSQNKLVGPPAHQSEQATYVVQSSQQIPAVSNYIGLSQENSRLPMQPNNINQNLPNPYGYALAMPPVWHPIQYQQSMPMANPNNAVNNPQYQPPPNVYAMHTQFRAIPVDKWNVAFSHRRPLKDGEVGLHQFIEQVEMFTQANRMHPDIVASQIGILLKGPALDWYLRARSGILGWDDLVLKMKAKFLSSTFQFETLDEITNRTQKEHENVATYISDMIKRFRTLPEPHKEDFQCYIIQKNLRSAIYEKFISERFVKIELLEERAKNVERNLETRHNKDPQNRIRPSTKPTRPKLYEVHTDNEGNDGTASENDSSVSSSEEVHAMQKIIKKLFTKSGGKTTKSKNTNKLNTTAKPDTPNFVCYKCKEPGHSFRHCPDTTEKFFCFTCGKDNVITPKCPNCNPKNAKPDSQTRESEQ